MGRYKTHEVHKYPEEALSKALKDIRENGMGVREASRKYGVPRGTIQDRLHGRVKEGPRKMGPNTILTSEEEHTLEEWLINLSKCGFPQKKFDLLTTVQKIIEDEKRKTPFKNNRPGEKWFQGFLRRHPNLSVRECEGLTKARSIITQELIEKWFHELKQYLESNGVIDVLQDPSRIFNGDETSFSMCPKSGKVLAPKGYKNIYEIKKGSEKETITVLLVFSADGGIVPPMVVFPFVRPNKAIVDSVPSDWFLGRSESGWMKSDIFYEYIANGMDKWLTANNISRPVLLLVDGHKSHLSIELSKFCYDRNIILYALPPNTTHIMQPADVSVFKPLKTNWKQTVRQWQAEPQNINSILTKCTFCPLLKTILSNESLPRTIQNGFRKCGLYPFNPAAVDYTKCVQNRLEKEQQNNLENEKQRNKIISEDQFDTTNVVLTHCKDLLTGRGIANIPEVIMELKKIKEEFYPITTPTVEIGSQTYDVLPDGLIQMNVNAIPIIFDFELYPNVEIKEQNLGKLFDTETDKIIPVSVNEKKASPTRDKEGAKEEPISKSESESKVRKGEAIRTNQTEAKVTETEMSLNYQNKSKDREHSTITEESETTYDKENKKIPIQETQTKESNNLTNATEPRFTKEIEMNSAIESTNEYEDLKRNKEKITILQDITIQNVQLKPFSTHLFYPSPIRSTQKRKRKDPLPAAISSVEYRKILEKKLEIKQKAEDEKLKRKEERINKKKIILKRKNKTASEKCIKNYLDSDDDDETTNKNTNLKKKNKVENISSHPSTSKIKESCSNCNLILDSDTEENDLINIGCDSCPKWYHLKCTEFQGCNFSEVANSIFVCSSCSNS